MSEQPSIYLRDPSPSIFHGEFHMTVSGAVGLIQSAEYQHGALRRASHPAFQVPSLLQLLDGLDGHCHCASRRSELQRIGDDVTHHLAVFVRIDVDAELPRQSHRGLQRLEGNCHITRPRLSTAVNIRQHVNDVEIDLIYAFR